MGGGRFPQPQRSDRIPSDRGCEKQKEERTRRIEISGRITPEFKTTWIQGAFPSENRFLWIRTEDFSEFFRPKTVFATFGRKNRNSGCNCRSATGSRTCCQPFSFSNSSRSAANFFVAASTGSRVDMSTPAPLRVWIGNFDPPDFRKPR